MSPIHSSAGKIPVTADVMLEHTATTGNPVDANHHRLGTQFERKQVVENRTCRFNTLVYQMHDLVLHQSQFRLMIATSRVQYNHSNCLRGPSFRNGGQSCGIHEVYSPHSDTESTR
jgi:hypothetical protein